MGRHELGDTGDAIQSMDTPAWAVISDAKDRDAKDRDAETRDAETAGSEPDKTQQWAADPVDTSPRHAIWSERGPLAVAVVTCVLVSGLVMLAIYPRGTFVATPAGTQDWTSRAPVPSAGSQPASELTSPLESAVPTSTPTSALSPSPGGVVAPVTPSPTVRARPVPAALVLNASRSVRSAGHPDRFLLSVDGVANVADVTGASGASTRRAATFTVVAGLADPRCYSFVLAGRYLRHAHFRLRFDVNDSTRLFLNDATFCVRAGSSGGSVWFESRNYSSYYVRERDDGSLGLDRFENTSAFRADISFVPTTPWA